MSKWGVAVPGRLETENSIFRIIIVLKNLLVGEISLRAKRARYDINKTLETTMCGLLNLVMRQNDWNLDNLNTEQINFPGIDLSDSENRIWVQVTSEHDAEKVKKTLRKFFVHKKTEEYGKLIVLMASDFSTDKESFTVTLYCSGDGKVLSEKKERNFAEQRITVKRQLRDSALDTGEPVHLEIWDFPYLMSRIENMSVPKQTEICNFLCQELGYSWEIVGDPPRMILMADNTNEKYDVNRLETPITDCALDAIDAEIDIESLCAQKKLEYEDKLEEYQRVCQLYKIMEYDKQIKDMDEKMRIMKEQMNRWTLGKSEDD